MLTICCYFCAEAETQADVYTETGLLKTERIAKMLNRREFQNLLALLGPEDRGGCCGCRWMDFSGKLPCCERSSPGSMVSTNPRVIDAWYSTVTWAEQQPCLKSLQGEGKLASNSELMDSTYKTRETVLLSLRRAEG